MKIEQNSPAVAGQVERRVMRRETTDNEVDKKTELAIGLGQIIYTNTINSLTQQRDEALDALRYLMQQFDDQTWQCPQCGHAEDTASMDSAEWLRDWLKTHNVEFSGPTAASSPEAPLERRVGGAVPPAPTFGGSET